VAIAGKGFFALNGPSGTLYTRNGSFKILPSGEIGSSDGYPVQSPNGSTLKVASGKSIVISTDGTVRQEGQTVGQIAVVDVQSTASLRKQGSSNFENTDSKNAPGPATGVEVQQGKVEGSNVPVAEAAMRLVGVMRQFEMLQKAITVSSDMDTKSIQEVARVSS
jgi:flagellar basal-body rod protein FlgG